jgi:deoxyribonuclease-4
MRRIGFHTSIAGGLSRSVERARLLGCSTMQIFSHNPRGWVLRERDPDECGEFMSLVRAADISPLFVHASYLINLAARDPVVREKSRSMVVHEMDLADAVGAAYVILHSGSASGEDPVGARALAAEGLAWAVGRGVWKARLLIENTAGERGDITSRVDEISSLIRDVPGDLIGGICLDTCHAYAAGYDIGSGRGIAALAEELDALIGKERIRLIHFNDSKGGLGSGRDRHEHIGIGRIGLKGLKHFLHHPFFRDIPIILETPKKTDEDDCMNLKAVQKLLKT